MASPPMMRIAAVHVNASACTSASSWMCPRICGIAISRLDEQQQDRRDRAGQPREHALEHERPADVPVRRADELHHLDLAPARVHESRIVFAMRIVEAASSTKTAMRKTTWIARAIARIRCETSLP